MSYAIETGSTVMIYMTSFIKIGSGLQKLIGRKAQTHREQGDLISILLFLQNKESRLKTFMYLSSLKNIKSILCSINTIMYIL
jgi:hypothetical protein